MVEKRWKSTSSRKIISERKKDIYIWWRIFPAYFYESRFDYKKMSILHFRWRFINNWFSLSLLLFLCVAPRKNHQHKITPLLLLLIPLQTYTHSDTQTLIHTHTLLHIFTHVKISSNELQMKHLNWAIYIFVPFIISFTNKIQNQFHCSPLLHSPNILNKFIAIY